MRTMRLVRPFIFIASLALAVVGMSNCSGTVSGFGTLSSYCTTTACINAASAPSIFLYTQSFLIPKFRTHLAGCSTPVAGANDVACNGSNGLSGSSASAVSVTSYGGGSSPGADVIYRQMIVISGVCTTSGAAYNSISYTVTNAGVTYTYDIYNNPYSNYSTTCDNGFFTLTITPPPDSNNGIGTIAIPPMTTESTAYTLNLSLKTGASSSSPLTTTTFSTSFYATF